MKSQLHCLHHQGQAQFNQWLLVKGQLSIIEGWAMKGVTIMLLACHFLTLFLGMITLQVIIMKEKEEEATCDHFRERSPM
jgi:hypothetical protein